MKNRKVICFIGIVLIIIIIGVILYSNSNKEEIEYLENPNLSIKIMEDTLSRSSASIIIRDNSNAGYMYSDKYNLEKYENNTWVLQDTSSINLSSTSTYYMDNDTNTLELNISWKSIYGLLSNGKYRIVMYAVDNKNKLNYKFYGEFTIDDNISDEVYDLSYKLDKDRTLYLSSDASYKGDTLLNSIKNNTLDIDELIGTLEMVSSYRDGGSVIYKYIDNNEEYYILACNTLEGNKDIYVSLYRDSYSCR